MKILDLFCGMKCVANIAEELGHEVITVDIDKRFNPTICADIMDIKELPEADVIWASPPCECFSVASIGKYWNKDHTPKDPRSARAMEMVQHTLKLIEGKYRYLFIENPRGKLRKMPFMAHLIRHTVTYCQYGDDRQKPTDIWTNTFKWQPRPMCEPKAPCHAPAPRGSRTGTQGRKSYAEKSLIPRELVVEILESCKE